MTVSLTVGSIASSFVGLMVGLIVSMIVDMIVGMFVDPCVARLRRLPMANSPAGRRRNVIPTEVEESIRSLTAI